MARVHVLKARLFLSDARTRRTRVPAGSRARAPPQRLFRDCFKRAYARVVHTTARLHCHICVDTADSVLLAQEKAGVAREGRVTEGQGERGGGWRNPYCVTPE